MTTAAQRAAFNSRRLVQAVRLLGQQGRSTEQALFVRALAESLDTDSDRNLAVELGTADQPAGPARLGRANGADQRFERSTSARPIRRFRHRCRGSLWSLAHGISRQESSFDPYAVSHAGARGMMQLMTGTAREQAGKMGVGFDSYRLISDPSYNVMIGSSYFQRMLNIWGGNVPLAVASYNAGSGNVGKWVRRYGDPRGQVDVLKWIEAIPYVETRAYVQRVIENSVVYDSMRGNAPQQIGDACLALLGKKRSRLIRGASWPTHRHASSLPKVSRSVRAEYDALFGVERPKIVEIVSWAASLGDRSENGDYIYGKRRLREIDRRLAHLARIMKAAKVVDPA